MNTKDSQAILEVIVCSVVDAVDAANGRADRLEIIAAFDRGGTTPPVELVMDILASVSVPVRVMIRETEEFTIIDESIIEKLCQSASVFAELPIDGLVLGFVRDNRIDVELTNRVLSVAPNIKATFHHAFEELDDPRRAIHDLKRCPQIDRILTDGGNGEWAQKIERLNEYRRDAAPEITILAGGGLDKEIIERIRRETNVREFHVGRTVRVPPATDGQIDSQLVGEIISNLRRD